MREGWQGEASALAARKSRHNLRLHLRLQTSGTVKSLQVNVLAACVFITLSDTLIRRQPHSSPKLSEVACRAFSPSCFYKYSFSLSRPASPCINDDAEKNLNWKGKHLCHVTHPMANCTFTSHEQNQEEKNLFKHSHIIPGRKTLPPPLASS